MNIERRFLPSAARRVQLRAAGDGQPAGIIGYAAVFYRAGDAGTEYKFGGIWANYIERIMPTAFDRAVKEDDVRGLYNHNPDHLLGRTAPKTLRLSVDSIGLKYEIEPPDTETGRAVIEAVRRQDLTGSSFSFTPDDVTWRELKIDDKDYVIREINSVHLYDVGPVTFPAYEGTTAGVRSAGDLDEARKSLDAWRASRKLPGILAGYHARAREVESQIGLDV